MIQFELHLAGKAYAVQNFSDASFALQQRLNPVRREAFVSAQLMRRKQQPTETVDEFVQDFENLFEHSYGRRAGMDAESREMLKRDLFVQGLSWKWQEKVLPSAESFSDALHQARAAEEQEQQLVHLHRPGMGENRYCPPNKPSQCRELSESSNVASGGSGTTGTGSSQHDARKFRTPHSAISV